ncbi:MAG: hypothetical protein IPK80_27225 [Nannocystis sp.]|nr:hypothetical protein [Nannocystis sp.]
MSANEAGEDNGHADHIFGVSSYDAPMPSQEAKTSFQPWHRPRKQFVRHHQWCDEIQKLVGEAPPTGGVLKYLGLPGRDLLDLRHFHAAVCAEHAIKLKFLGFNRSAHPNSEAQTELNVSMDEVKRLTHVHPQSDVIGDDFEKIANDKSIAFQKACEFGPFDVINLDLCDGFAAREPGGQGPDYYKAVTQLMSLQARSPSPWLMFLTTRADSDNIDKNVLRTFIDKYCANLTDHECFRDASRESFAIETEDCVTKATHRPDGLLQVFLTGLCKWFVGLGLEGHPPTNVELRSAFGYRVVKDAPYEDLVSLALKFIPTRQPVRDRSGLATTGVKNGPSEGKLATRALKRIAKRIDADKVLNGDAELLMTMTTATERLLTQARYDATEFRKWATQTQ